jgi:hypothetical protein
LSPLRLNKKSISNDDLRSINSLYKSTIFNESFTSRILEIDKSLKEFNNLVGIHIRSGDVVYGAHRKHGAYCRSKSINMLTARNLCEYYTNKGNSVVVFGATSVELDMLAKEFDKVLTVTDLGFVFTSNLEAIICEVYLMSKCESLISSADTGVTVLASSLGAVTNLKLSDVLNEKDEYLILKEGLLKNRVQHFSKLQRAFICLNAYTLGRNFEKFDILEFYLKTAAIEDDETHLYHLILLFTAIKHKKVDKSKIYLEYFERVFLQDANSSVIKACETIKVKHFVGAAIRISQSSPLFNDFFDNQTIKFFKETFALT